MQYFLVLLITSAAVCMDLRREKISNYWILISWGAGLFWQLWNYGWWGWIEFLAGSIVPVAVLFFLFLLGMLGAGDIKLFSAIGGVMGLFPVLKCIIAAFCFGAVLSLGILLVCGNFRQRMQYFRNYMTVCLTSGIPGPYRKNGKRMEHIHFSVPIWMSALLFIGGFYG